MNKRVIAAVLSVAVIGSVAPKVFAVDPVPPAPPSPSTQPAGRTPDAIKKELDDTFAKIGESLLKDDALNDPDLRAKAAPTAIPLLKKMVADLDEIKVLPGMDAADMPMIRNRFVGWAAVCGDADSVAALQKMADSKVPAESAAGKSLQLSVKWMGSSKDAKTRAEAAAEAVQLAKANPDSKDVLMAVSSMVQGCSEQPELADKLVDALAGMKADGAAQAASALKEQMVAERKLAAFENQPIVIAGKTPDGKDFSTADLKGKVVLVDFWATWCGPCRAELPRVKKIYADYKPKGFEILGVSNDQTADDLKKFLADNKDMAWPQVFDAGDGGGFGPITSRYGIQGIPTMFLIDKKGVLRSVKARENMEKLIPQLLDEK